MTQKSLQVKNWQIPDYYSYEYAKKKTKYCLCIPVINEGEKIKKQILKLKSFTKVIDIIILDGGSNDGSLNKAFLTSNSIRCLLVIKNAGKQGAQLRMGFAYALQEGYEGVITMDGNNKDGVDAIPYFIKFLQQGYDCIAGSRFIKGAKEVNTPLSRNLGIRIIASPLLSIAARHWLSDVTNGFMGYSKHYLLHPKVKPFRNIFISYELLFYLKIRAYQLGLMCTELPVIRQYPKNNIPTKIHGIKGKLLIINTLIKVFNGFYIPS